jgi:hypothetical protein
MGKFQKQRNNKSCHLPNNRKVAMKKIDVFRFAACLVTLMGSLPAMAQVVHVDFTMSSSFYAGNAKLPAGTYTLKQMPDESTFYDLQNSAGTHSVMLEARPSSKTSSGKPEIVFNRYGTTEFIEGVETSNGTSVDFISGAPEKLAAKKGAPQSHTVPTK